MIPATWFLWKNSHSQFDQFEDLPNGFKAYGIDVSHHQGKVNWENVFDDEECKVQFVYCKATEGINFKDEMYTYNKATLDRKKIPNGAYHFFQPSVDPIVQANFFLKTIYLKQNDLPPVLDVEKEGKNDVDLISRMIQWLKYVEKTTGKRPVIYTSYHFYTTKFQNKFKEYKFWIANYNDIPERLKNDEIIHWQFSDNGAITGISTEVDLNYSKIDF